jgi:hypothetical protein
LPDKGQRRLRHVERDHETRPGPAQQAANGDLARYGVCPVRGITLPRVVYRVAAAALMITSRMRFVLLWCAALVNEQVAVPGGPHMTDDAGINAS